MRQAGIIAAGALYALDHHVEGLANDHTNAQVLAEAIGATDGLDLEPDIVDTNIVIFHVDETWGTADELCQQLLNRGVRMFAGGPQSVRAVTHLGVTADEVAQVARHLCELTS